MTHLALVVIHHQPIDHVHGINEELRSSHAFEEVSWSRHLGHEFNEEHCTTICIYTLHKAIDRTNEIARIREAPEVAYGWIFLCLLVWRHEYAVEHCGA